MTGEEITKVKAFVEVRRIPGVSHHPIEQMRRWQWLVTQEIVNQLDALLKAEFDKSNDRSI